MKSNEAVRTTSDILIRGSIMLCRCAVHRALAWCLIPPGGQSAPWVTPFTP